MAEIVSAVSVLIAALSFLGGVSAWKREFVGKRRIELAESVLAQFYEAEDAIRDIRNPFSTTDEGTSRKRGDGESQEEAKLLDQAYVVIERYQKHEKLFSELRSLRYRCMAVFGPSAAQPFNELSSVLNEIFAAAQMLGRHYWPRQGRVSMSEEEFSKHIEGMQTREAVFWYMGDETDEISTRVRNAVEQMEVITSDAVKAQATLLQSCISKVTGRESGR